MNDFYALSCALVPGGEVPVDEAERQHVHGNDDRERDHREDGEILAVEAERGRDDLPEVTGPREVQHATALSAGSVRRRGWAR